MRFLFLFFLPLFADKIAIVSPYSWTTPGGVNAHIAGLREALQERGHEVLILAPADGPVPAGVVDLGPSIPISYNGSVARISFNPSVAGQLSHALKEFHPDVIHIHEPFSPGASFLALLEAHVPTVGTFHMGKEECKLYDYLAPILTPLWMKLGARICVSPVAQATIQRHFSGPVHIIPNGIDTRPFAKVGAPPKRPTIAFLGRLEERKGARILLEALPYLKQEVPDVEVLIAGDGPQRAMLEAAYPDVTFLGRVRDVTELASKATLFCVPSLGGESFGIILLEAMASGRPIVASDLPSYRGILGSGSGLLVPPGDPKALAHALAQVLNDPALAESMVKTGRRHVRQYDWRVLAPKIESVYRIVKQTYNQ